jgi:hypothetical protein
MRFGRGGITSLMLNHECAALQAAFVSIVMS